VGGRQYGTTAGLFDKNTSKCTPKRHFLRFGKKFQKILKTFCRNRYFIFNKEIINFSLQFEVKVCEVNFYFTQLEYRRLALQSLFRLSKRAKLRELNIRDSA
jgi:hypothetical protein